MKLFAQSVVQFGHTMVAGHLDQASMESHVQGVVRINISCLLHLGHHGAKLRNVLQTDTAGGKASCQAEQMSAHVVNLRGLRHTHFPDEHTAIRNHSYQVAFLQTSARFAYRSSTYA